MDYSKYASLQEKKIIICKNLIEFKNSTWQVKNIVNISIHPKTIPFDVQQPQLNKPEPKLNYNEIILNLIAVLGIGAVASKMLLLKWLIAVASVAATVMAWWFITNHTTEKAKWRRNKKDYEKKVEIWHAMKKEPPLAYALSIEPSANTSPICYTFDCHALNQIVKVIKQAMVDSKEDTTILTLHVIEAENDTALNALGSSLYDRKIKEITGVDV